MAILSSSAAGTISVCWARIDRDQFNDMLICEQTYHYAVVPVIVSQFHVTALDQVIVDQAQCPEEGAHKQTEGKHYGMEEFGPKDSGGFRETVTQVTEQFDGTEEHLEGEVPMRQVDPVLEDGIVLEIVPPDVVQEAAAKHYEQSGVNGNGHEPTGRTGGTTARGRSHGGPH